METIKKRYIVNEQNKKMAVQIDFLTYKKIEEILENYGLVQLIKENENDETLDINKAKNYYKKLGKVN
ncbi:hypothetical protein HZA55_06405 [Candidatus Poribacteria bacterium]|nr:hypothetical protein [Candidatus Poribacteria bacterium]